MLKAIEGGYRDGKVLLSEGPPCEEGAHVIVVFPEDAGAEPNLLADRGISPQQAAELRWRLRAFEADWNVAGMEVYDEL